jgi:hypothetical protein
MRINNEIKLEHYKNKKKKKQEHDLDLKTKICKCMANVFFYRQKFKTIDLVANYCFSGGGWTKFH